MIELYRASTLGERRPIEDRGRMARMMENANLAIAAWDGDLLARIARSCTTLVQDSTYTAEEAQIG
jgi:hypothetical protein